MSDIHKFHFKDKYLVLDVESNALHELDPVSWRALELLEAGLDKLDIIEKLKDAYGEGAVAGALKELAGLKSEGLLWSDRPAFPESQPPCIKALCFFATDRCNLSCLYCFARRGRKDTNGLSMSLSTGKAAVDFLLALSGPRRHCEIDYFGGEPLLNWPVMQEVTEYAREQSVSVNKEIAFTVTTNALQLTDKIAGYLENESMAAVLSLDGRPGVHNAMRPKAGGRESYRETVQRILGYASRRPRGGYYIRGTYTRYNMDFCSDVEHLYNLGLRNISMEPVVAPPAEDYALREEDLPLLEKEYEKLTAFYLDCLKSGDPFKFFHFSIDLEHGPCLTKRLSGCGAGREYLAVTPDGTLYPCHQLAGIPEMQMGHVMDPEGFCHVPPSSFIPSGPLQGSCRDCWARYHCGGGCRAASYLNGDPSEPYPLECALQRKRLECALYLQSV